MVHRTSPHRFARINAIASRGTGAFARARISPSSFRTIYLLLIFEPPLSASPRLFGAIWPSCKSTARPARPLKY